LFQTVVMWSLQLIQMLSVSLLLIGWLSRVAAGQGEMTCGPNYTRVRNKCYYVSKDDAYSGREAEVFCEFQGGTQAYIKDFLEVVLLRYSNLLSNKPYIINRDISGFAYDRDYRAGRPQQTPPGPRDCVALDGARDLQWAVVPCRARNYVLCEAPGSFTAAPPHRPPHPHHPPGQNQHHHKPAFTSTHTSPPVHHPHHHHGHAGANQHHHKPASRPAAVAPPAHHPHHHSHHGAPAPSATAKPEPCPSLFTPVGKACYYVSPDDAYTGSQAEQFCTLQGGSLATIRSWGQMSLLARSYLGSTVLIKPDLNGFLNFDSFAPRRLAKDDCVIADNTRNFRWRVVSCKLRHIVLCEAPRVG